MVGSGKTQLTVDEAVSVIKKSNLPNVVIEGLDDTIVYRKIEQIGDEFVSLLTVGGRSNVLSIFERRNEFRNKKVAFIADKDIWVMTGIPEEFKSEHLIFTNGYSIENDVFQDVNVYGLMDEREQQNFKSELCKFLQWFSIALDRNLKNIPSELKTHPNHILDDEDEFNRLITLQDEEIFPENLYQELIEQYDVKIRGKSLLAVAMRSLSYKGRPVKHNHQSVMEHASSRPGDLVKKIFNNVEKALC